jgi:hypothetical protein
MSNADDVPTPSDGALVSAADLPGALTAAAFVYADGATQVFTADGRTTYVERGRPTAGEWSVTSDGGFASFWPPDYRAGYEVRWIVEDGSPVGLSFTDARSGERFDGRYRRSDADPHPAGGTGA